MFFSLNPERLKRYKNIAMLIIHHNNEPIFRKSEFDESEISESDLEDVEIRRDAVRLREELQQLGPTFIKLGQLLSTRPDLLSRFYIESLSKLQDEVESFPFEEVEKTISLELGVKLSKAFKEFNPKPIAAASLGQVHRELFITAERWLLKFKGRILEIRFLKI